MQFSVKVVHLGNRAIIAALALQDNKSYTLDLLLSDYFSPSAFPYTLPLPQPTPSTSNDAESSTATPSNAAPTSTSENKTDQEAPLHDKDESTSPLEHLFIHQARLKDLITLYRINILQKLLPGLRKEGYLELDAASSTTANNDAVRGGTEGGRLGPVAGRDGYYPDTGGPLGVYPSQPPRQPAQAPSRTPFDVGRADLDPMGLPLRNPLGLPDIGGVGGPLDGGDNGGGMYVGPNHPLFRERFGEPNSLFGDEEDFNRGGIGGLGEGMRGGGNGGGVGRRWGGDSWLPEGAAPPGARFDPIGPGPIHPQNGQGLPGFPGSAQDPFGGRGGRGGGGFGRGRGGLGRGGGNGGFGGMGGGFGGGGMFS